MSSLTCSAVVLTFTSDTTDLHHHTDLIPPLTNHDTIHLTHSKHIFISLNVCEVNICAGWMSKPILTFSECKFHLVKMLKWFSDMDGGDTVYTTDVFYFQFSSSLTDSVICWNPLGNGIGENVKCHLRSAGFNGSAHSMLNGNLTRNAISWFVSILRSICMSSAGSRVNRSWGGYSLYRWKIDFFQIYCQNDERV